MSKLLRFKDTTSQLWARIDTDNDDPIFIGLARTGVLVKRSRLGFLGHNIFKTNDAREISDITDYFLDQNRQIKLPSDMRNLLLRALTIAALSSESADELCKLLNSVVNRTSA